MKILEEIKNKCKDVDFDFTYNDEDLFEILHDIAKFYRVPHPGFEITCKNFPLKD
jgi:hypothetical protein